MPFHSGQLWSVNSFVYAKMCAPSKDPSLINTDKTWIRIAGTLGLISFIAISPQIFIIIPLFQHPLSDRECFKLLLPFNFLVGLLLINYALCITTDPGRVPKQWDPFRLVETEQANQAKKLLIGRLRFCRACKAYKPPRAHHCRSCKRFLWSVNVACWYHVWMISKRVFGEYAYGVCSICHQPEPKTVEMLFLILNYVACLPVILAVGVFSLYHLWALLSNVTTIEGWEKGKARELQRKGRIHQFTYPFSLGTLRNIQAVLGSNPLLWWLPKKMAGDGLTYPVMPLLDPLEQYLWPPQDLFTRRDAQFKRRNFDMEAFTYGHNQLNPSLTPTQSTVGPSRNSEGIKHRAVPPYHLTGEEDKDDSDSGRIANGHVTHESESDAEPLSSLMARRKGVLDQGDHRRPTVRRGSEGFEVKAPAWSVNLFEVDSLHTSARWPQDEGSEASDGWD